MQVLKQDRRNQQPLKISSIFAYPYKAISLPFPLTSTQNKPTKKQTCTKAGSRYDLKYNGSFLAVFNAVLANHF